MYRKEMQVLELEQEQKKQKLTFEEICPKWAKKLNGHSNSHLDIDNGYTCIVGEAHGFNQDYLPEIGLVIFRGDVGRCESQIQHNPRVCERCGEYSRNFPDAYKLRKQYPKQFENLKDMFVEHWNECHLAKT